MSHGLVDVAERLVEVTDRLSDGSGAVSGGFSERKCRGTAVISNLE